jgi:hypothetical protein
MEKTMMSRRSMLRRTVTLTTAVVAATSIDAVASEPGPEAVRVAPDHDAATGEIVDRDRHHHWDTV